MLEKKCKLIRRINNVTNNWETRKNILVKIRINFRLIRNILYVLSLCYNITKIKKDLSWYKTNNSCFIVTLTVFDWFSRYMYNLLFEIILTCYLRIMCVLYIIAKLVSNIYRTRKCNHNVIFLHEHIFCICFATFLTSG